MPGLLLIDKPAGITSFGAVAKIKRITGEKRVGHTGTLDPMATGVLPVFTGRATVLSSFLLDADKTYIAKVRLGVCTDTLDITGKVTRRTDPGADINADRLNAALFSFVGKYMQTPPMFSAVRRQGIRLYELARRGEQAEIEPRQVEIYGIKLLSPLDNDYCFSFEARVSKGTYIRSLVRDLGEKLGTGAVLTALNRTATAGFTLPECISLDRLDEQNVNEYILPADTAVKHLEAVNVTGKQAVRFSNGGQLDLERVRINDPQNGQIMRVYCENSFLGLGRIDLEKGQLAVKCIV